MHQWKIKREIKQICVTQTMEKKTGNNKYNIIYTECFASSFTDGFSHVQILTIDRERALIGKRAPDTIATKKIDRIKLNCKISR